MKQGSDKKTVAGIVAFGGCWLVGALLSLATTVLVIWGLWEGIQWLQRH
ncbi:hypothetical protein SEA_ANNADREAMY_245 [Streptomyces phage Annadreamy]|uniref:Uncharacterized protein n=3 Tax=Annadreamyvirus TaxID=2843347 RepID=A0A345GTQ2_9CAUD|nr:hypothetical protein HWB75_gp034 [Streptomyces phage Annadreamy]YP_009839418.1 hypothetical protein HWB76_gp036 [Streptomyces phage Blueeyedbeauty]QGH79552.1 hypothetical protein SEA_LIMPID_251 [Streptomyces phage Limpid]QOI67622.1 hypothetical protein SEA_BEUFFERT_254 [Streptomyces phage Beuffert]AXG66324.1 hypothetical protein SEA_ANNADREAMY_245 [Streptomyces phage Annadreamy]AXH49364.1 hypothetical protein SEA_BLUEEYEDBEAUTY_257 [Streptomyces phage Blueeyedbeauty]